jgi:predicted phage terminase large subunit-like protein
MLRAVQASRAAGLQRKKASSSLGAFIHDAWHVLEPATVLQWNRHLDAYAEHLEAVTRGQIRKLVISVPPGEMKSLAISVFWPAWEWAQRPELSYIAATYNDLLSLRDAVKHRDLVKSEWYRKTFSPSWSFTADQDAKGYFKNTMGGFRLSTTVGGGATGHRGHRIIVDDATSVENAYSEVERAKVIRWWTQTMSNRFVDMARKTWVVIAQRTHEGDLPGHILAQSDPEVEHLCLPAEFEKTRESHSRIGWTDWRSEEGELLDPVRLPKEVLDDEKRTKGSAGYAAQYQQRPMPAEGGMFKGSWWRFWRKANEEDVPGFQDRTVILPDKFDAQALSWDCAFKDTKTSKRVAGGAWGRRGADKFLLELEWDRMTFTETVARFSTQAKRHPKATAKLIEDKANGSAVIDTLRSKIPGIVAVDPEGGKEARAAATSPQIEAGNIFIPLHAAHYRSKEFLKRDDYIAEHDGFPLANFNDAVDQQSQMLLRWSRRTGLERLTALTAM